MNNRAKEWIKRYVPAELLSTALTLIAALITFHYTQQRLITALAATWSGNVSYFGYIFLRDVFLTVATLHKTGKRYTSRTFYKNVRALVIEFGPAELMDSLVIRPALMYYLPLLTGNMTAGIIIAKFAADITFYVPAIVSYELSKKRYRKFD